jgi:predicted Zn-dependent protease
MLEQARRQEPQNPAILEQTLRVLHRQRDRLRARSVVNDLLHIDPGHAFGNLMLGSLQYSDGDLTPAESSFRASLERNPTSEAYNSLAYVLVEKGRFTDALPLVQKARELSPENVKVTDTLAMTYLGLNRVPEALETIRLAVAGAPNNSELLFHLALILEKSGVEGEALAICDDLFARMSQVPPYLQTDLTDLRAKLYERVKKSAPAPST